MEEEEEGEEVAKLTVRQVRFIRKSYRKRLTAPCSPVLLSVSNFLSPAQVC